MSNFRVTETRRQRTTTRGGYGASNNRSTFGYWVPLALTVTAATVGLVAWIWSERSSEEEEYSSDEYYSSSGGGGGKPPAGYNNASGGFPPGPGPAGFQGPPHPEWQGGQPPVAGGFQGPPGGPPPPGFNQGVFQETRETQSRSTAVEQTEENGLVARMSSALGIQRAPSPGQAYNWASKGISAGVAAAGAMVGVNAMSNEHKQQAFDDQSRWSEEAEQRDNSIKQGIKRQGTADEFYSGSVSLPRSASLNNAKRRTVAIVVSSEQLSTSSDIDVGHSSILAHLPEYVHPATTKIFVLIYAPNLQTHPLSPAATGAQNSNNTTRRPSQSMASSFSNISLAEATTPGSFEPNDPMLSHMDPQPIDETTSTLYKTLHNQALALVDRDAMIMPFTSPQGHKHILKSLQPEILYIQEGMCGSDGEIVSELQGWVRTCVVVIGDEGGTGGLVDTDDEAEARKAKKSGGGGGGNGAGQTWWKREDRTGLGRGVEVVEALKISDDWRKRVNSED